MCNVSRWVHVIGLLMCVVLQGCVGDPSSRLPASQNTKKELKVGPVESNRHFGEVAVLDGVLTIDGEKYFIAGVGYEPGCRPGFIPWERPFQPELMSNDFRRICDAGFNTIRTWSPMTDEEFELAREFGLWVIQGLWFDPTAEFDDPEFQQRTFEMIEREITRMSKHDNILYYLLFNEPHGEAVFFTGIHETEAFYAEVLRRARKSDPKRLFSYSNCVLTDFMSPDKWDIISQNVYPYSPCTIDQSLGYSRYLRILKNLLAAQKPLVITEFGLSVSPAGDGRGYGGNTLEQQAIGVVSLWDDIINSGCAGGCAFMWIDGWWKHGDEHEHGDHAEEWYGLLEADTGLEGTERPVYFELKEYNRAIRWRPHARESFGDMIPVEVWAHQVKSVEARIADGDWVELQHQYGRLWQGQVDCGALANGSYYLETRGITDDGKTVSTKRCPLYVSHQSTYDHEKIVRVSIENLPKTLRLDADPYCTRVMVTDADGKPLAGRTVRIARFVHTRWDEFSAHRITDNNGMVEIEVPLMDDPGVISISAAVEVSDEHGSYCYGDYQHCLITN